MPTTKIANAGSDRRVLSAKPNNRADRIFNLVSSIAAHFSIVLVLLILGFLVFQSWPALKTQGFDFLFGTQWDTSGENPVFQIGPMLWGSIQLSLLGLSIAIPMAIASAYFIEFMAPKRLSKIATGLIDLLAAMPSVVLGLWGYLVFMPVAAHWAELLNQSFGWFPPFKNDGNGFVQSPFIAGWIVGIMIVPIIASVAREIFSQVDRDLISGAKALGGSNFTIFRRVIFPVSMGGVLGGILLALGRALGETVAVYFVLNIVFGEVNWYHILNARGGSIASNILARFGDATQAEANALMASGLVLFVFTLGINTLASWIVNKAQPWRQA